MNSNKNKNKLYSVCLMLKVIFCCLGGKLTTFMPLCVLTLTLLLNRVLDGDMGYGTSGKNV